ncbi:MAG: TIR domain-containing protein [Rhizobiaceae bacterium]
MYNASGANELFGGFFDLGEQLLAKAPKKRTVFFSFHFADVFRVDNVRGAFGPSSSYSPHFVDGSIWERSKAEGSDGIKRVIREGMEGSSVVCVLVGSETWSRPWVRYEIARSVIDGKGLLAVQINGIRHHGEKQYQRWGFNPLDHMGVAQLHDGSFRLCERDYAEWRFYREYSLSVPLPRYLPKPNPGFVTPLSRSTLERDYAMHSGHANIGLWIDAAAQAAGR